MREDKVAGATAAGGGPRAATVAGRLRESRGGLFVLAVVVGAGSGLGAVAFRYLISFLTWLFTGHSQFGQQGYSDSPHLPWLGLGCFVVLPVIGVCGNADIDARVNLPRPCIAPIVLIVGPAGSGPRWLAATRR